MFIKFTPEGTLQRRWFLIQADIPSTCDVKPKYATNNIYRCVFLYPNTRMMQVKVVNIYAGGLIGIGTVDAPVQMILCMINVC